jgi:hypothetical protein
MTDLSMVRMISHGVVRLAVRTGSAGHPTDRWQDKSRSLPSGRPAADGRKISDLARCALLRDSLGFTKSQANSATLAHHSLAAYHDARR